MTIRTRIVTGVLAALSVVIFISTASTFGAQQLFAAVREVNRTHAILRELNEALGDLIDIENGSRGFALSGRQDFLEPFERGRAAALESAAELRGLLGDDAQQLARVDRLMELIRQRTAAAERVVAARQDLGLPAAAAEVATGRGKALMDAARAEILELHIAADHRLDARLHEAQRQGRMAIVAILGIGGFLAVLVGLGARSLSRAINRPLSALIAATGRVARGEPPVLPPAGHDEIGDLTRAFGAMAEERRRAESLAHDLVEQAADAIFLADEQGQLIDVNQAACTLLGAERGALVGRSFLELLPADDSARFEALRAATREGGAVVVSEWRLQHAGGAAIPIEMSSKLLGFGRWQLIARDIRERRAVEAERARILAAERQLRHRLEIIRASALAISELDARQGAKVPAVLQAIVDHARHLTGADFGALGIGTDPDEPFDPWVWSGAPPDAFGDMPRPRPRGVLGQVAVSDAPLRVDDLGAYSARAGFVKGHPQMAAFLGVPIRHHGHAVGNLYLTRAPGGAPFTADDEQTLGLLASHAAVAIENARLYDEVLAAVRARDELVAVVSHDLKNPLNAIAIHEQLLGRRQQDETLREHSLVVRRAVTAMQRMVHSLLDTASLDAGQLRLRLDEHPLEAVVDEVIDVFVPIAADRGVRLARELPPLPPLRMDRERVIQVLHNLVGNGLKHTREGGVVISARQENGTVEVTVSDSGSGISAHDLPHIFDRFYTTAHGHQGAGLGLHIVRRLVEAHGGRVWAESAPGTGTRVSFALPLRPLG